MASSSSISPDATTRRPTNSLRSHRLEARSHLTRSQEIYTSLPSTWARGLVSKLLLLSKPIPSKRY